MTALRGRDDRGSMSIVFLVVLLGLMLGALLVPTIVTSIRVATFDKTRVQALGAAQAGIDVTLGLIRASSDGLVGDTTTLPCDRLSGSVGDAEAASYDVQVEYFTFDPASEAYPSDRKMGCVPGLGPHGDPDAGRVTPAFVRIVSTGAAEQRANGASPPRTLSSTYVLRTLSQATERGLVKIAPSAVNLCLDVGTAPAAGTTVVLQPCDPAVPPSARQVFTYTADLTLQVVSSTTASDKVGLCVDHTPASVGDPVVLARCGPRGAPVYSQQWSYNGAGQYQAFQADSATTGELADLCLTADTPAGAAPPTGRGVTTGPCGAVLRSAVQDTYER